MTINIFDIIQQGERVTLECKQAKRSVPNSLWDTYSAFANTYGGTILLGVVEHLEPDFDNGSPKSEIRREQRL
ncbi:MAG: helix-turn-helix domain-containing protein, partial [Candidatus Limisoma sp.]